MSANVLKALAVTAELTGAEFSKDALGMMLKDLGGYPEIVVLGALDRCRKELRGRLTLGAILDRIEEEDGRPGADEAWAIAIGAQDEADTVVWTDEIAQAFGVAKPILDARDKVGARMAFREAYDRLVRDARTGRAPVQWIVSAGHDPERRATALSAAVALRRIDAQCVQSFLPVAQDDSPVVTALLGAPSEAARAAQDVGEDERERFRRGIAGVRQHLADLERQQAERTAEAEARMCEARKVEDRRRAEMRQKVSEFAAARGVDVKCDDAAAT